MLTSQNVSRAKCLICDSATVRVATLCSSHCAAEAHHELRRNASLFQRLRRDGPDEPRIRALTERNGQLSSALMGWRSPVLEQRPA